ncbi:hypothetical protein WAH84_22000, partial [Acinetobacter baumannii]
ILIAKPSTDPTINDDIEEGKPIFLKLSSALFDFKETLISFNLTLDFKKFITNEITLYNAYANRAPVTPYSQTKNTIEITATINI